MRKTFVLLFLSLLLFSTEGFSVARTWVGIGAGGAGTNFNAAANWSPAGVPTAADALTISITAGASSAISLSASITVGSLDMSVSGSRNGFLRANGFVLTVNGAANFNAVTYSSPVNYSYLEIDAGNAPGGFVFNGATQIHTTGSGDTYIGGATVAEGSMTFNANLTMGAWSYTNPGDEPIWIFNAPGAQTISYRSNYHIKPSSIFVGTTNSPSATFNAVAPGVTAGNFFTLYDGQFTIGNASIADIGDFDFDPWVAGTAININSTATLRIGNDNNFPGFGVATANPTNYGSYTVSSTSTVHYYGGAAQSVSNLANPGYGHITYSGAGAKTSAGNFSIRGNWTNNGTFNHNSNTHTFNGTPNQTIGGTSATVFFNLVENKASGSLLMGVNNNQVNNVLTLTAGPLDLNSFTLIINNASLAAVVRTSGYIISETNSGANPSIVQWNMGATTGAFVFPFGTTGAVYIPFTFNKTTATVSNVSVSTRPTAVAANTPWASTVTHMYSPTLAQDGSDEAVIDRWWHITCTAATTANLTFSYRGAENTMIAPYNTGNVGAQYWSAAWLPNNSNIGSAVAVLAGVGTVTANAVGFTAGAFTPMVLSSLGAPLPVELISAGGDCVGGFAHLEWSTASETDNSHFVVMRSDNGEPFMEIGREIGNGTTSMVSYYDFVDDEPLTSTTVYRLIQYDFNGGSHAFTPFTIATCEPTSSSAVVYNETEGVSVIIQSESEATYVVSIHDMQGRLITTSQIQAANGVSRYTLSDVELANGIYIVSVTSSGGQVQTTKIFAGGK